MIHIVAKNTVKKEQVENFKMLVKELIIKSKKEKGCIAYDLYEDISNPSILTFIEIWENEKAIELHNQSNHFKQIVPKLGELVTGKKDVKLYKKVPINLNNN